MFYLASGCEERVREVFESRVTRLNAWSGARACTFRELGARGRVGRHSGHTGGALERASRHAGHTGGALERASMRAGASGERVRGCERGRAAARAATGVLFTREHVLHPKSPK
ncbi:hypothetical protein CRG98_016471 [Punica granatum]|uniref:Uncharacterized protein n=1 Tax=Punica granatum TaxID=22663 RepID=A0A2I0K3L2_PUNGR|nr:hypothetical protein CRG98_016471 [Punica granatum]